MSLFYFNLVTPFERSEDQLGIEFLSLDMAYLDACQAALEISVEALRRRQDPSGFRFEVLDVDRRLVLNLPFSEVLRPGGAGRLKPAEPLRERIEEGVRSGRELNAELAEGILQARLSLETAKATLRRGNR